MVLYGIAREYVDSLLKKAGVHVEAREQDEKLFEQLRKIRREWV